MKNIKHILLIAILSISGASCSLFEDFLDVRPENQILLEEYWQKGSDVEAVLMTCYRAMQEDDFMYRLIVWGELRSDNVIPSGSIGTDERYIHEVNILTTNSYAKWAGFYKVINYCNTLLEYAPLVVERDPNFKTSDLQAKEAEALAIRSLCYFYLVRTFRDVPLSLDATISDDQELSIPQSTPEEVLSQITEDLLKAEQGAQTQFAASSYTKGRMTKDAIRALLADVYLWRGMYSDCISYCDELINAQSADVLTGTEATAGSKYALIEEDFSYEIFYSGSSSESIFELQFTQEKSNEAVAALYGNAQNVTGQFVATVLYAEGESVFDTKDERQTEFITTKTDAGAYPVFKYLGYKWNNQYNYRAAKTANWIFYRIADVMLMKAEALVQLNRSEEDLRTALTLVNKTYMRSHPTLSERDSLAFSSYDNAQLMQELVLLERQRELMFEGKRWFDLVRHSERNQSTDVLIKHVTTKYSSDQSTIEAKLRPLNAMYMPIHADELNVNPLLEQNPYYLTSSNIEK